MRKAEAKNKDLGQGVYEQRQKGVKDPKKTVCYIQSLPVCVSVAGLDSFLSPFSLRLTLLVVEFTFFLFQPLGTHKFRLHKTHWLGVAGGGAIEGGRGEEVENVSEWTEGHVFANKKAIPSQFDAHNRLLYVFDTHAYHWRGMSTSTRRKS
jgi:hypothetical protein